MLFLVGFVRPGYFRLHLSPTMMHNNSDRSCLELLRGEFLYSGRLGQPTPDGRVPHLCRHLKGTADVSRPPLRVVRCRKVTTSI